MVEKIIHANTLKRIRKELNLAIGTWNRAKIAGEELLRDESKDPLLRFFAGMGASTLPDHIIELRHRRNTINKMLERKKSKRKTR